jgi:hypothetical protein
LGTHFRLGDLIGGEVGGDGPAEGFGVGLFDSEEELLLEEVDGGLHVLDLQSRLQILQLGGFVGLFVGVREGG